jgi:hypothetical protein
MPANLKNRPSFRPQALPKICDCWTPHQPVSIYKPTMIPTSKEPDEAEILLNRVNVALARSQRLIASWLPQSAADEDSPPNTQERLVEADDELFQPDSELQGPPNHEHLQLKLTPG